MHAKAKTIHDASKPPQPVLSAPKAAFWSSDLRVASTLHVTLGGRLGQHKRPVPARPRDGLG